jgi:hypothetical protein
MYRAETWSLYEDDRRRINAPEMDPLRRSARISKLDRKIYVYVCVYIYIYVYIRKKKERNIEREKQK